MHLHALACTLTSCVRLAPRVPSKCLETLHKAQQHAGMHRCVSVRLWVIALRRFQTLLVMWGAWRCRLHYIRARAFHVAHGALHQNSNACALARSRKTHRTENYLVDVALCCR